MPEAKGEGGTPKGTCIWASARYRKKGRPLSLHGGKRGACSDGLGRQEGTRVVATPSLGTLRGGFSSQEHCSHPSLCCSSQGEKANPVGTCSPCSGDVWLSVSINLLNLSLVSPLPTVLRLECSPLPPSLYQPPAKYPMSGHPPPSPLSQSPFWPFLPLRSKHLAPAVVSAEDEQQKDAHTDPERSPGQGAQHVLPRCLFAFKSSQDMSCFLVYSYIYLLQRGPLFLRDLQGEGWDDARQEGPDPGSGRPIAASRKLSGPLQRVLWHFLPLPVTHLGWKK